MTSEEFETALEEIAKIITAFHNRLVRIEEWMIKKEQVKENEKNK